MTYTQVTDRDGNKVKNLIIRDGNYYIDVTIRRKRYIRRVYQDSLGDARRAAAAMIRALRNDPAGLTRARSDVPRIAALLNHYRAAAEFRRAAKESPSIKTSENCIGALLLVVSQGLGADSAEDQSVSVISDDLIRRYIKVRVEQAGDDLNARERARLSAASTINQARAIFASWAMEYYRKHATLNWTSIESFRKCTDAERVVKPYERPPETLIAATKSGAALLRSQEDHAGLYTCYLLTATMGLRAGECEHLQWSWFFEDAGRHFLRLERRGDWSPKGRSHTVAVSDETWAWLQAHKTDPVYVLPGASKTARHDLIGRAFATWMRGIGWDPVRWPKAAHELRKLFGSEVYGRYGATWASEWLGHADVRTTKTFYADPAPSAHPAAIVNL
jgi:integrase